LIFQEHKRCVQDDPVVALALDGEGFLIILPELTLAWSHTLMIFGHQISQEFSCVCAASLGTKCGHKQHGLFEIWFHVSLFNLCDGHVSSFM
jgi:hypothetical protein